MNDLEYARTILWANGMPGFEPLDDQHPDWGSYSIDAEEAIKWALKSGALPERPLESLRTEIRGMIDSLDESVTHDQIAKKLHSLWEALA